MEPTKTYYRCHMVLKGTTRYDTFHIDLPDNDEIVDRVVESLIASGHYDEIVLTKETEFEGYGCSEPVGSYMTPKAPDQQIIVTGIVPVNCFHPEQ